MSERKCVLALMAHPDDIEFQCAGTLCRLKDLGWEVHLATCTHGDCGSTTLAPEEIAAIRTREAEAAAATLGATYHCLDLLDVFVFLNEQTLKLAIELLRRVQPTLLITHSPQDYMLDHEQASVICRDAAFCAPIKNALTGVPNPAPPLDHIPHLYYADPLEGKDLLGNRITPTCTIDISTTIERKAAMLACHASQREWLLRHHGVDEYLNSMREWSGKRGAEVGVAFAEGFRQHLGHAYPQDDLLVAELGTPRR